MRYAQIDPSNTSSHKIISIREFSSAPDRETDEYIAIPEWVIENHVYDPKLGEFRPEVVRPQTVDEALQERIRTINAECDAEIARLKKDYPVSEVATWVKQEQEARDYVADGTAEAPFIDLLASERGLSTAELANRIIAKADAYDWTAAITIGKKHRLEDRLNAIVNDSSLTDEQKISAIKAIAWQNQM